MRIANCELSGDGPLGRDHDRIPDQSEIASIGIYEAAVVDLSELFVSHDKYSLYKQCRLFNISHNSSAII